VKPRGNLRFRLLAGAAVWVIVALVIAGLGLSRLFEAEVARRQADELINHLNQLTAALEVDSTGRPVLVGTLSDPRFRQPYSGLYWQVSSPAGGLLRSRSLWDVTLELPPAALQPAHEHEVPGPRGSRLLVVERRLQQGENPGGLLRVAVGVDRAEIDKAVHGFDQALATSLGLLAVALLSAAVVQVWIGLRPLAGLRSGLAAIRGGRSRHLDGTFPNEIQPLVDDLNNLLAHDAALIERARAQAGNLAHGLKTSLTALLAESDELMTRGETELAAQLRVEVMRIRRHVDHYLARARAAGARDLPGVTCNAQACIAPLLGMFRRLKSEREIEIVNRVDAAHRFRGEAQDLEDMLGNLIDNACKWAKRCVRIASRTEDGQLVICVDDDGPGLSLEQREEVFARGRRLDESVPGSGLGLTITREIAELYGGTVELDEAPLGGLRAYLRLPGGTADA
jgi:signal transduction histidine kinase